jgi:hypothetical protein
MRDGSPGTCGIPGDEESVTYTSPKRPERSNPTLTAIPLSDSYTAITFSIESSLGVGQRAGLDTKEAAAEGQQKRPESQEIKAEDGCGRFVS